MLYKGKINELKKMVVSDPSYGEDVWCRYERNDFPPGKKWAVQLKVNESHEEIDGLEISGIEFTMLLCIEKLENACRLGDDGGFFHPMSLEVGAPTEIGMDTACVALGINARADMIKAAQDEWQPQFALKTLTDGLFGDVFEGKYDGAVWMVVLTGYLDEDTCYSVKDVVDYLVDAFEIKDLTLVQGRAAVNDKIAEANSEKKDKDESFEARSKESYDRSV